jgi:DNA-binding transcriptional LysR family regulator
MALKDHLEKLHYISEIAKHGSIRSASKVLRISQPSVSIAVRILEEELRCKLFVRTSAGMMLTKEGELLLEFANRVLHEAEVLEHRLQHKENVIEGVLRLATHESISIYFLPDFIHYLRVVTPKLRISLITGRSKTAISHLKKSVVDLAITVEPQEDRYLRSHVLFKDQFNLYLSPKSKYTKQMPLILMPDAFDYTESTLEQRLGKYLSFFTETLSCENHETVRGLTEEGLGVGLIPDLVAEQGITSGRLGRLRRHRIPSNFSPHSISLSILKSRSQEPLIKRISEEMIHFSNTWSPKRIKNNS